MHKEKNEDYETFKETIAFGGCVSINGRPIDSLESLQYHYNIKEEEEEEEEEGYEIETEDKNNSI